MKEQTVFKKELTEDELVAKIEELDKKIKDREADRYYADSFEQASQISDDISDLFTERNALKAKLDKMLSAEDKGKETMPEKSVKTETKTFDEEWFNDNLDIIEQFIEKNYNDSLKGGNDYISFSFEGTAIANPFLDEAGTISYNLEESIKHYGKDNVMGFLQECKDKLCADKSKTRKDNLIER